ncbi:hypothetical protein POTOM_051989 [Populus tomentosa]|uniref:Uncharacterized protein n=3 Tax=Populus TaxID=3689 RepID=A0A8X7Y733_POPTO|nr:hypothetical protein POTOM_051989 [Populus tomentosa]
MVYSHSTKGCLVTSISFAIYATGSPEVWEESAASGFTGPAYKWWIQKSQDKLKFVKMPALIISTNVSLDGVDTSSILSEATSEVAKVIGKPEKYVMIVLKGSIPISLGGTEEPAAYGELVSIGGLSPDVNKTLSSVVASILEKKLSVPKSRLFLKFYDSQASHLNS